VTTVDTGVPVYPGSPRLTELLIRIADGALQRERDAAAPHEQVGWLREAGIGRLRIPAGEGGGGASLPELLDVVIDLAAADPNVAHILRAHFGFVEQQLNNPDEQARSRWLALVNANHIFGPATSEQNGQPVGRQAGLVNLDTRLSPDPDGGDGFRLNGVKFYSTGSLFASWITVQAHHEDGSLVAATIPVDRPGVTREDDWDGFGQRLTGTGTTRLTDVIVYPEEVQPYSARGGASAAHYYGSFYQLYLQAITAGILRAVESDAAELARSRSRNFTHASHSRPAEDPQVLQVVGEIAADAFAARAIVLTAAEALQKAADRTTGGTVDADTAHAAQLAAAKAKVAVDRFSYAAAARLLDVGGASATQSALGLDRHWRNIRTLSTHNPTFLKATAVGGFAVNGTPPPQNGYF
jgi:alkylation response protein AidB-like acyl-CoA dehydrogenase